MASKSKFIAIEGLDGSGKSTQIDLLIQHFEKEKIPTKFIHFPRHHIGVFGNLISRFLRGEFGTVDKVHPQLVALLFAEDRKDFATTMQSWLNEDCIILVDRYVLSNIAFQCAKLTDLTEKETLKNWILNFEYEYNKIPMPDLSFYLEVPFSFTQHALSIRRKNEERTYLQGQEDIHENDLLLQQAVKYEYESLIQTQKNIIKIKCYNNENNMRSKESIHQEILNKLA